MAIARLDRNRLPLNHLAPKLLALAVFASFLLLGSSLSGGSTLVSSHTGRPVRTSVPADVHSSKVHPDTSCFTKGSVNEKYPVDTQENLCFTDDGATCDFAIEYGNFLGIAVTKLMIKNSACGDGECRPNELMTYQYDGNWYNWSACDDGGLPYNTWLSDDSPQHPSYLIGSTWQFYISVAGGDNGASIVINSSPL